MLSPTGIAATLHDAVALAQSFGPGHQIGFGHPNAAITAPGGVQLTPAEAIAAIKPGHGHVLAFTDAAAAPLIAALTRATAIGFMPICLASPWTGRTVYQGQCFDGSRLRDDLVRSFAAGLGGGAGLVPHQVTMAGATAIRQACAALKTRDKTVAVIDAISDDDCVAIAEALGGFPLIGGAAWLAQISHDAAPPGPAGPLAILSGACDRQTIFQLGAARPAMPVFDLDMQAADPAAAARAWAADKFAEPFIIAGSATPDRRTPGAPVAAMLGGIARSLADAGVRRFVITGDETAAAIIAALELTTLTTGANIGPLTWLQNETLAICIKPSGGGSKNLFLSEFEPQIRLNTPAECAS